LRLWDAPTAARVLTGHTAAVSLFAVSPNGQQLVTSGADQSARVWNLADGAASWTFPHAAPISALAWRADGAQLATGSANKQLLIWSTADGQKVQAFDGHAAAITAVSFLPDNTVAAACADGHVKIWNVAEKKEVADLVAHDQAISSLHVIPGGQQLAVVTANGNLKTFQISDRKPLQSIALGTPVLSAATSADGKLLVTLGQDQQLRVITTADLKVTATIPVNAADVTSVSISNDGQRLALGTTAGLLRVLGADGKPVESLDLGPTKTNGVGFVLDQKTLVVASDDPRVRLVRPGLQKSIHVADKALTSVAYTPDGAAVVVGGEGQGVTVWNLATGQALRTIAAADSALDLALSPDGSKCYTVHADQSVKGWQVADGAALGVWPQPERIRRVRLSRDGSRLLLGGEAGAARVLETATGRLLERFALPAGPLGGIALLPDNRTLVTAAADGQVRRHTLAALVVVAQHPGGVLGVSYSANSQSVLSCGADKGARISDLNGKVMVTLQGADTVLNGLALRGDGSQIVGLGQDQQLYIWPNGNGQLERKVPLGVVPTSVCYATDGTRVTL
ncbi:MAG: WD40 repeat domain-containing protein, partial [Planctomycetota bacterium]